MKMNIFSKNNVRRNLVASALAGSIALVGAGCVAKEPSHDGCYIAVINGYANNPGDAIRSALTDPNRSDIQEDQLKFYGGTGSTGKYIGAELHKQHTDNGPYKGFMGGDTVPYCIKDYAVSPDFNVKPVAADY